MKIGLIGKGAIGEELAKLIEKEEGLKLVFVFDEVKEKSTVKNIEDGLKLKPDLVVECASTSAVLEFAQTVLSQTNLLTLSSSAFVDKKFEEQIKKICKENNTKVFVPSGAIIGLDGISAVKKEIKSAKITSTKNPKGFGRTDTKKTILFEGSARKAAELFPKNVNVAATLALNSIGFDKTKAIIVSDPNAKANTHEIEVEGEFGKFYIKVENKPSTNPKTSALAAKTTFELIKNIKSAKSSYP